VLAALAGLAVVILAFGYGLFAGNAHGHADAMEINDKSYVEGPDMTLKEFMTDPSLRREVQEQLEASFEATGEPGPEVDEVIKEALSSVSAESTDRAVDMINCNHVDDCRAKALVLGRFANWMESHGAA
jgi:hypothetical protein